MTQFEGTEARFERLVAPHERQVYFTCLRMMGNRQDAEDTAQEAMVKAWRAFGTFRGDSKVSTWLYTIATRCCLDALKRRGEPVSLELLKEDGWEPADEGPSPYLAMEEAERKRLLHEAIGRLSAEQRVALVLCDLQGLSYQEAAQAMDCPIGTVRSRLGRAREALKKLLSAQGELFQDDGSLSSQRRETK